jgi:uncharacterized RDD family membrane protein YckC
MASQLTELTINSVVSLLAWQHYKSRIYPASEKYSTFSPRLLAGFVDALVIWPVTAAITFFTADGLSSIASAALFLLGEIAWAAYTIIMHAKYGQTFGKMICKVRVVDVKTSDALSIGQAITREIPWIALSVLASGYYFFSASYTALEFLSWLPLAWLAVEVVTMLTNEKRRALHDFIAGTMVIRTNTQPD